VILVAIPDGTVNATDRALWLTLPFDMVLRAILTPGCRVYEVPLDDRVYEVPLDDRVYEVQCG